MAASDPRLRVVPPSEPAPPIAPAEPWWSGSFLVTLAFKCNIACTFCMVEDALGTFEGTTLPAFRRFAEDPRALQGAKRIILSGGEVTLARDLLEYVAVARSLPGIEHVRIQTNAIRLGNREYLRSLLDAGVDEFFVSLHAADAPTYDALARKKGAFEGIVRGLEAIRESGATLLTNTAIVETNAASLPAIVDLASRFAPRSMEFWNYWPRTDDDGARMLAARVTDVQAPLHAALASAIAKGIPPVVKWFPRCLLGPYAWCQDDGQPPSLIEEGYWAREPEYSCLYEGVCAVSVGRPAERAPGRCAGLSDTYVHRFGWEENLLKPMRQPAVSTPRPVAHSLTRDAGPRRATQAQLAQWLSTFGISARESMAGFELTGLGRTREGAGVLLTFTSGNDTVTLGLAASVPGRKCPARTKSFDLFYKVAHESLASRASELVRAVAARVAAHDPGGLALP
jgi:cyclic pyranopterin phosphate synthase